MNKKVLIITYYWPPSGGSGVQRWLKFVKYLPSFGWEPHVFTPENPFFAVRDPSLEKDVPPEAEVMRLPIWEPYELFYRMTRLFGSGKKEVSPGFVPRGNRSLMQRISTWVRGNFFIPDPRVFWVKPSVKFLADYVRDNGIHVIITTGPPHSIHLIGLHLKRKHPGLRWLADFRDPWSEWGMWDSLGVSKAVRHVHKRMESRVLATADEIITITPFYVGRFEKLSGRKVALLTNGYDEADFHDVEYRRPVKFTIRHVGIVNEKCDPRDFMRAVKQEMERSPAFAADVLVEFNGEIHPEFKSFVSVDTALNGATRFTGNVPHDKLMGLYGSSSLLVLVLTGYKDAEGFLPGKLFEYLATGLPILGVGPLHGDAAFVLSNARTGVMVGDGDIPAMQEVIRKAYDAWARRDVPGRHGGNGDEFSRKSITGKLSALLEKHLPSLP